MCNLKGQFTGSYIYSQLLFYSGATAQVRSHLEAFTVKCCKKHPKFLVVSRYMSFTKSILRYPGGKTRFAPFIEEALKLNKARVRLFAEPFCGGASVSISLLERGVVDKVALNDSDLLIASLWQVIFSEDAEWLAQQVLVIPLTIEEWRRQKAVEPISTKERALKCLYLNRTSFNGIIYKAGPLGGWGQTNRTIGVRFSREKLAARIRQLALLRDRVVAVENKDWKEFCKQYEEEAGAFFYCDPPYFHKAEQLYGQYFQLAEHISFRDYLGRLNTPWLLSYDDATEIRSLYKHLPLSARVIDSTYSAHPIGGASFVGRELFFSNLKKLPSPKKEKGGHCGLSVKQFGSSSKASIGVQRTPITTAAHQCV